MKRLKFPARIWSPTAMALILGICLSSTAFFSSVGVQATKCISTGCGAWNIVESPDPASYYDNLSGVGFVSPTNVWAVGSMGDFYHSQFVFKTLIEHWNGASWSVYPSPNIGPYDNALRQISVIAANNIWAVGDHATDNTRRGLANRALIEHWNGAGWRVVPAANPGPYANALTGVAAVSQANVWAVGQYQAAGSARTLTMTERWDGTQWKFVPSPNPGRTSNNLAGVVAFSANNIWAAGTYSNDNTHDRTLIEHWNGASWSVVASPNATSFPNDLLSISGSSANDIWAVGYHYTNPGNVNFALIEHWNGAKWSIIKHADPGEDDGLLGVISVSHNIAWTVGYSDYGHNIVKPLIESWNGTQWSIMQGPTPNWSSMLAVGASPSNEVWSVGYRLTHHSTYTRTLTEHYHP